MLASFLPYMRCPACQATRLQLGETAITCPGCGAGYPFREGVLDLMRDASTEVITPFQKIMQSRAVVTVYENLWRPAGYFLASSRTFSNEVRSILKMAQVADRSRVLDLACGPGVFTRPLAAGSGIVIGLDLSWPMLFHARRRAEREGIRNVLFLRGTAFRLPFIAGAFTAINCCGALHLFDQAVPALREMKRVLVPGGHFTLQTTIRPRHSAGMSLFLEKFIRFGFFEEEELREMLRGNGFKVVQSERHRISFSALARSSQA